MLAILAGMAIVGLALFFASSSQASGRDTQRDTAALRAESLTADAARRASAKNEALKFVRESQDGCRELTRKINALSADSVVEFSELNAFIPAEIYPPDAFVVYIGDGAFGEVKGHLSTMVSSLVDLLRSLGRNRVRSITGSERTEDDATREREAFNQRKLKALTSATSYCESVRRASDSVGTLN